MGMRRRRGYFVRAAAEVSGWSAATPTRYFVCRCLEYINPFNHIHTERDRDDKPPHRKDSMGDVKVPAQAYFGAQTQRAVENFPISHMPLPKKLIHALGLVKVAAAVANRQLRQAQARRRGADASSPRPRSRRLRSAKVATTRNSRSTFIRPAPAPRRT